MAQKSREKNIKEKNETYTLSYLHELIFTYIFPVDKSVSLLRRKMHSHGTKKNSVVCRNLPTLSSARSVKIGATDMALTFSI